MVARISVPKRIRAALLYNENKVEKGVAELIHAEGFAKRPEKMSFEEKLESFTDIINRNTSKTNSLHISLNFDAGDELDKEKLKQIADNYMDLIGFGEQPYLVYQHHDAGHRHVHIVTTNIKRDGTRINTYNIAKNKSEKARKEIEERFCLVKAEGKKQKSLHELKSAYNKAIAYGKTETRNAIRIVLLNVLNDYNYTSLSELNAVLQLYNVRADRGGASSNTYKHRGLIYHILDERGKPIGVPIKASLMPEYPGLHFLEKRFGKNLLNRTTQKRSLKNAVDRYFLSRTEPTLDGLMQSLQGQGIDVVTRKNETGLVYGITYVDHNTKTVFNGSDLGKAYSANGIRERCEMNLQEDKVIANPNDQRFAAPDKRSNTDNLPGKDVADKIPIQSEPSNIEIGKEPDILEIALRDEQSFDSIDSNLLRNKKKKSRRKRL